MTYRIVLSRKLPTPKGAISSSIMHKCQEQLCKLYPGKGLDWAPRLTDDERNGLWEKHFDIKILAGSSESIAVEFMSEQHFLMHLIKWS